MAAADVRHFGSALQLVDDAVERRQPGANEVRVIARAEETLGAVEEALMVLTPLHAFPRPEIVEGPIADVKQIAHDRVRAGQVDRAVRIGEAERLLRLE